ncbi:MULTISPECIES: hypothetical protein [unclassified Roseateles]|uniref:hypothetical protein n=1 Tax=unclassified Roseateles TaxID=2626991 RepID=UPI0006FCD0C0|nr:MULTISPECIES: hypothetical protein [unclassified Roseateles]KQW42263.1 hypothetical protein ASC81_20590 [Pelomonas sp. Root405]KRA68136.1 hypothetical protein ASD88_22170 [Pelomonas sp. Root662]
MRALLRCLLVSLLILTLPLKGLAAAGYMACGPAHAGAALPQHHATADSSSQHDHHAEASQSAMDETSATKCVQCAPCCGAVAPQAEAPSLATEVVNADTVLQAVRSLVVGGRIDRIDRPPRSLR